MLGPDRLPEGGWPAHARAPGAPCTGASAARTGASIARGRRAGASHTALGGALAAALWAASCVGTIGEPGAGPRPTNPPPPSTSAPPDAGPPARCQGLQVGPAPLRRLTRAEYNRTVRDLLGDDSSPADQFVAQARDGTFDTDVNNLSVPPLLMEQYLTAAEALAERAASAANLGRLMGCDPTASGGAAASTCVQQFIASFGRRAYRRPLARDEVDRLVATFTAARDAGADIAAGVQWVLAQILVSPNFLYRVELGDPAARPYARLSPWEIAARLSYLLRGTMPDDALFSAAESGQLATADQIAAQARRLIRAADGTPQPDARAVVARFHAQWLGLDAVDALAKDPSAYPEFDAALRTSIRTETERFLDEVAWQRRDATEILNARYSFLDERLARLYGVAGVTGDAFRRVDLDPRQRAGVLTQASFLATAAGTVDGSPIRRGVFVRERILCRPLPPPPPGVASSPPPSGTSALTTRQRFAAHSQNPTCAACHHIIDSLGFGFEHYDGLGRFRTDDHGAPVDARGEVIDTDVAGAFDGAVDLGDRLARSDDVRACMVTQWLRFAQGRAETTEDACTLAALQRAFASAGNRVEDLLVALTQTDAFVYRPAVDTGP